MNDEERKALAESRGRVANLRAMFNKGGVQNAEPPAWKRRTAPPPPIKLPTGEKPKEKHSNDSETHDVLHLVRTQRELNRKAEEEAKASYASVKSSETLVDAAIQERKLRENVERRTVQECRDAMAKQSSYDLESDHVYKHSMKQKEYERSAEQKAKASLSHFTSDGETFEAKQREEQRRIEEEERKKVEETKKLHSWTTYSTEFDQSYTQFQKQRENATKAEQEAQHALRTFAQGKTFLDEQLDEQKRVHELERQKEQLAKTAPCNFSSPEFDHAYVHAKKVAQVEKAAEEKAKAALLKYDQHDVSHEYVMKNGFRVPKYPGHSITPEPKRYPFTDPAARIKKPSPQSMKALARFQMQLAESRAQEEQKALSRHASCESMRKLSIESVESMESGTKQPLTEVDLEQIKASVDDAKLDVRSAAQKFAEMDRKAAELAKQNKKPLTFNGVSYGLGGRGFRTKEQERKEVKRQNDMATRIQTRVRGTIARRAYSHKMKAAEQLALRIQTAFRRRQAQKQLQYLRQQRQEEETCAVVIQTIVRGRVQWRRYQRTLAARKAAAIMLQSLVRSRQAQTAYRNQRKAAFDIQVFVTRRILGWKARKDVAWLRKERAAATSIQTMFRTRTAILQAQSRRDAVLLLQCAWRQHQARKELARLVAQHKLRVAMAIKIQSHWRGSVDRSKVAMQRADATRQAEIECSRATKIQSLWRGSIARSEVATLRAEEAARQEEIARQKEIELQEEAARQAEIEFSMATKIQSLWRGSIARSEVATLRAEEAARQEEIARQKEIELQEEAARQAEIEGSMATKIQSYWRGSVARSKASANVDVEAQLSKDETISAIKIQSLWRGACTRTRTAVLRADAAALREAREIERQVEVQNAAALQLQCWWHQVIKRRQTIQEKEAIIKPTLAELQLLSQTGRFSIVSDDSDDDSAFEDASGSVKEVASTCDFQEEELEDQASDELYMENDELGTSQRSMSAFTSRESLNLEFEFSMPEYDATWNDTKSDASSDVFVDAIEEHKPLESAEAAPKVEESTTLTRESSSVAEQAERLSGSLVEVERPSSLRSSSFLLDPSFDSDISRESLASSRRSSLFEPRDESSRIADPFRSRQDSYAASSRSRDDSYADSRNSRHDSYADVFRSRSNSYDETLSRENSYADGPSNTELDAQNQECEDNNPDGPKYFDTDSDRASSIRSPNNSPISHHHPLDLEKDDGALHKSGTRWHAASVLSALSSRRSTKPSSSTSSMEEEEKEDKGMMARTSTMPSVVSLSSVASLLNRKKATTSKPPKSFEAEIEESVVYSPQEPAKPKSRFSAFPSRFAWKK